MEDEINLIDYIRVINKRKWMIISLTIVLAIVALIYSLNQPKLYKATATLMPIDSGAGGLSAAISAIPFFSGATGGMMEPKLIPILKSRSLAKEVITDFDLIKIIYKNKNPEIRENEKLENVVNILLGAMEAKTNKDGLLMVSISWNDPILAAQIANNYIDSLGRFLNRRSLNINFQVIDPAIPNKVIVKPTTKKNVILTSIFGFFAGIIFSLLAASLAKAKI